MKVLALDSSGMTASVAIIEDDLIRAEYTVDYKKTHSQTVLPMLDEIVNMTESNLKDVDAVAVAAGPGSFTGLRIGAATAKGLGLALNVPLIHVPTTAGMAYNLYGYRDWICPIMDARRNQVYTGIYTFVPQGGQEVFRTVYEQKAMSVEDLIIYLNQSGHPVIFLGDGVPVQKERLEESLEIPHFYAPAHLNRQRAAAVATLGMLYYKEGRLERAADFKPDYLRVSQAERERAERERDKAKKPEKD